MNRAGAHSAMKNKSLMSKNVSYIAPLTFVQFLISIITDKKTNNKVLEEDNDVTPEDLVTLEGEGTEKHIFLLFVY